MPIYNFECKKCGKGYSELCSKYDDTGKYPKVKCPHCKSVRKIQTVALCSFAFANPEGTDRWNSDSTGHDYRFKHKAPSVAAERQMATEMSHMGATPYSEIDDTPLDTGIHDNEEPIRL